MKNPFDVMPSNTARLFEVVRANPLLDRLMLIGGTALSLHIGHRISEDLDFVTLLPKPPRVALKEFERQLEAEGHHVSHHINPSASEDFLIAGMDLADSQQDWIVDHATKVTFFSAEPPMRKLMEASSHPSDVEIGPGFKIASFPLLCQLKATVTAMRSKSRDWLDLFILEREYGFGIAQWKESFDAAGLSSMQFEIALNRMCLGSPAPDDEGFAALMPEPPTIGEIQDRFRDVRASYELATAQLRADEMREDKTSQS